MTQFIRCVQCGNPHMSKYAKEKVADIYAGTCQNCQRKQSDADAAASSRQVQRSSVSDAVPRTRSSSSSGGGGLGSAMTGAGVGIAGAGIGLLAGGVGALAKGAAASMERRAEAEANAQMRYDEVTTLQVPRDMDEILPLFLSISSQVEYRIAAPVALKVASFFSGGDPTAQIGKMKLSLDPAAERFSDAILQKMETLMLAWKAGATARPDYANVKSVMEEELQRVAAKRADAVARVEHNNKVFERNNLLMLVGCLVFVVIIAIQSYMRLNQ
jgi:hypothetical protein